MNPNADYLGIVTMLRSLREQGLVSGSEAKKIAARLRQAEQAEDRCSGSKDQQSGCGPDLSVLRLHDTASFPVCHCNKVCSSAQAVKAPFS